MLTEDELKTVLNLIDLGIRTEGLKAVEALYPLAVKCSNLLKGPEPEKAAE